MMATVRMTTENESGEMEQEIQMDSVIYYQNEVEQLALLKLNTSRVTCRAPERKHAKLDHTNLSG